MVSATMATPKRKPKRKTSFAMVNMKVSDKYRAWLDRLAKHCRTDVSKLMDRGLILVAKAEGFDEEVPER